MLFKEQFYISMENYTHFLYGNCFALNFFSPNALTEKSIFSGKLEKCVCSVLSKISHETVVALIIILFLRLNPTIQLNKKFAPKTKL